MEIAKIIKKTVPVLIIIALIGIGFAYYSDSYTYPPCCDTAITLIKARVLAHTWDFNATMPVNPSASIPLYSSVISTEFPLHVLLALVYAIVPSLMSSLSFAKIFFLIIFLLPIIPLFVILRRLTQHMFMAATLVVATYFSFWYGNMYWTGHVAQMLGISFLLLMVLSLLEFDRTRNLKYLVWSLVLLLALFFVHVLSFLVAFLTLAAYGLILLVRTVTKRHRLFLIAGYLLYTLVVLCFFVFVPDTSRITPGFSINDLSVSYDSLTSEVIPLLILMIFLPFGFLRSIRSGQFVIISFFFGVLLLTQSQELGVPFYAYRFVEFMILPAVLLVGEGMSYLQLRFTKPLYINVIAAAILVIALPIGIQAQNDARKCYITNCAGLHPTQLPHSDEEGFRWLAQHATENAVVFSPQKFGYYIPVVAGLPVEFPEGEKNKIMTAPSSEVRHSLAIKYHISYIVWGGVAGKFNGTVLEMENFTEGYFNDSRYFTQIYENNGTRIYEVKR